MTSASRTGSTRPVHMGDVVILEAAQHMGDGVAFADVGQELVAEPLALGRALDQTRDVDKGHPRGDDLLGLRHLDELPAARVGHGTAATLGSMVQKG
jgi:hypothetical protein